jgi:hypothetical protein
MLFLGYLMMPTVSAVYSVSDGVILACGAVGGIGNGRGNGNTPRKVRHVFHHRST